MGFKKILVLGILPSIFSGIMLMGGFLAWKRPLGWERREEGIYPHYYGEIAFRCEENWRKAQMIFGKTQCVMGVIHILMEVPEVMLFAELCRNWPNDNSSIPTILALCFPGIFMVYLGKGMTTRKLKLYCASVKETEKMENAKKIKGK